MTVTAIITLSSCLGVAWGGLALAMLRLRKLEGKKVKEAEDGRNTYQSC